MSNLDVLHKSHRICTFAEMLSTTMTLKSQQGSIWNCMRKNKGYEKIDL